MEFPPYTVTVTADKVGLRLDQLLANAIPELSRVRLRMLIEGGHVDLAGHGVVLTPNRRVRSGEDYQVVVPMVPPFVVAPVAAQPMPLTVVHEDEDLLVIDKPAGLVVHPGAGNPDRTLVNALRAHCGEHLSTVGGPYRPGIVHRLDKDTCGLMVVAKTDEAHYHLARQFAAHTVERAYYALVWGQPEPPAGVVRLRIGRSPADPTRMAALHKGGKEAETAYRTLKRFGTLASLMECRPATGRTHQIRVHMAALGHPLVGDPLYGDPPRRSTRITVAAPEALSQQQGQALHAYVIAFDHPSRENRLYFENSLSMQIKELCDCLESV